MQTLSKRIEIVTSTVSGLSSIGQDSREGLLKILSMYFDDVRITIINTESDLESLVARQPDLVFVGMKYLPVHPELGRYDKDKIWLTEVLDLHGIAYTGSDQAAHKLELDKSLTKQRVQNRGIKTAAYYVKPQDVNDQGNEAILDFPLFIKPTDRGGGEGIDKASVVRTPAQLSSKLKHINNVLKADALVEQYLEGREFSVAVLKKEHSNKLIAMPLELVAPKDEHGNRVLTGAIKRADSEQFMPVTHAGIRHKISVLALAAFKAIGARDYGRIDIRMDTHGVPHFLEANLLPSLLEGYGNFPKACLINEGLTYESVMLRLVRFGFQRQVSARSPTQMPKSVNALDPILLAV